LGLYCGIDWATDHHDVAVVDDDGRVVAGGRVGNDAAGFTQLLMLLAEAGDSPEHPIPVAIETDHGLWVAALRPTPAAFPRGRDRRWRRDLAGSHGGAASNASRQLSGHGANTARWWPGLISKTASVTGVVDLRQALLAVTGVAALGQLTASAGHPRGGQIEQRHPARVRRFTQMLCGQLLRSLLAG
jgi:Transposase